MELLSSAVLDTLAQSKVIKNLRLYIDGLVQERLHLPTHSSYVCLVQNPSMLLLTIYIVTNLWQCHTIVVQN